jgi:hypothetical protein
MRKWDKKSDSCAAEKGAKKLVSSDCAKIPEVGAVLIKKFRTQILQN